MKKTKSDPEREFEDFKLGQLEDSLRKMNGADSYFPDQWKYQNRVFDHLDALRERGRGLATSMLVIKGEDEFASMTAKRGISPEAAATALGHALRGTRSPAYVVDALLYQIPATLPSSPGLRLLSHFMPRVAGAIAETAAGLKERNEYFKQQQQDCLFEPAVTSLSCAGALAFISPRPADTLLALGIGALTYGVNTIRNAHREGKIASVLGRPAQSKVSPFLS